MTISSVPIDLDAKIHKGYQIHSHVLVFIFISSRLSVKPLIHNNSDGSRKSAVYKLFPPRFIVFISDFDRLSDRNPSGAGECSKILAPPITFRAAVDKR